MCRSKAEGGRRCPGGPAHDGRRSAGHSVQARVQSSSPDAGRRLGAEIDAVRHQLSLASDDGGDAQLALEKAAARIRTICAATAPQAGDPGDDATTLSLAMLGLASRIDSGLADELTSRRELLHSAADEARN